jgi:hypothetical protein
MSRSVYLRTYYGVEVPRSAFFAPTNTFKRVCAGYPDDHPVSDTANFCDRCGAQTAGQNVEEATKAFREFCAAKDVDPAYVFNQLTDAGWPWSDPAGRTVEIGWFAVQSYHTSGTRPPTACVMALGVELDNVPVEGPPPRTVAYSLDSSQLGPHQVPVVAAALREFTSGLGLPMTPQLFTQVYVS